MSEQAIQGGNPAPVNEFVAGQEQIKKELDKIMALDASFRIAQKKIADVTAKLSETTPAVALGSALGVVLGNVIGAICAAGDRNEASLRQNCDKIAVDILNQALVALPFFIEQENGSTAESENDEVKP